MASAVSPGGRTIPALAAVALALKIVDKGVRKEINASTRATVGPIWKDAVNKHLTTEADRDILGVGVRIAAGNPSKAIAGASRRKLSGGATPTELARAWEFGSGTRPGHTDTYRRRSAKGGSHDVTRHTRRQLPMKAREGRVVYKAWADTAPRMVSLWVSIVVRNIHEAFEQR